MAPRGEHKILRIGIIQGGKIIEERLVRSRENVTLGSGPKNTFVLPASSLPKSLTVFEVKGSQYVLAFTDAMEGRVALGETAFEFAALKSQNLAKKRGAVYLYPVSENARGKVTLGDVTLLFQFVTPPPEPPKPVLPKEMRGGWVKSIDKFFTALLVISFVGHLSGIIVLENTPLPTGIDFDQIPDRFARLIMPDRKKEETPPELPGQGQEAEKVEKNVDEDPEEEGGPAEEDVKRKAATAEVQDKVRNTGLLAIIGVAGDGASAGGLVADLIGGGSVSGDLDEALRNVSGVAVASNADAAALKMGLAGGGDGQTAGIGDLATAGSGEGKVGTGVRKTPTIRGNISAGATEVDSSTVDAGAINRYIKVRMKSIVSCYEAELKRNPALKGKLVIRIVINTRGLVGDISIEQDTLGSSAVTNCVRNRIRPWRFPVKPEEDTPVAVPFIFAPSS